MCNTTHYHFVSNWYKTVKEFFSRKLFSFIVVCVEVFRPPLNRAKKADIDFTWCSFIVPPSIDRQNFSYCFTEQSFLVFQTYKVEHRCCVCRMCCPPFSGFPAWNSLNLQSFSHSSGLRTGFSIFETTYLTYWLLRDICKLKERRLWITQYD